MLRPVSSSMLSCRSLSCFQSKVRGMCLQGTVAGLMSEEEGGREQRHEAKFSKVNKKHKV